jgi:hypothetical protein
MSPRIRLAAPFWVPGATLQGEADLGGDPTRSRFFTLRLSYWTEGKGERDEALVEEVELEAEPGQRVVPFRFRMPEGPYSFSGSLISLCWAVDLAVRGEPHRVREPFVLTPTGDELLLERVPQDEEPRKKKRGVLGL